MNRARSGRLVVCLGAPVINGLAFAANHITRQRSTRLFVLLDFDFRAHFVLEASRNPKSYKAKLNRSVKVTEGILVKSTPLFDWLSLEDLPGASQSRYWSN